MHAALHTRYGAPDVLALTDRPAPSPRPDEILIQVMASPVTVGDRRVRSADFPGIGWLPGRLMMGLFRPRNPTPGTVFAGRIEAVGSEVTRWAPGDRVFGTCPHGAWAEYLTLPADGAVARIPEGWSWTEAATLPYGGLTAQYFLQHLGRLQPGERVLIIGAAGGVGRFAVQLARHLGARITAMCHSRDAAHVRQLGAESVICFDQTPMAAVEGSFDVILDTPGVTRFSSSRRLLVRGGRYLTLSLSAGILAQMAFTSIFKAKRALFGVALGSASEMEQLADTLAQGAFAPLVRQTMPLDQIVEAHIAAEQQQGPGTIVLTPAGSAQPA